MAGGYGQFPQGMLCCCSVTQPSSTLCDHMDCSMAGFPVLHHLLVFAHTHVHWIGDAIQPSHSLLPPSPPAINLSQHQILFQWVSSSHQMAKDWSFNISPFNEYWGLISFRIDLTLRVWSPCCPRDSQESSLTPQFKSINSLALSLVHGPTLTSIHDY